MTVEIGKYAGFCRGVKRAVNGAFECARETNGEVYADGELIHNPQTLSILEHHNVFALEEGESLDRVRGKTVIVRAHGVTPARLAALKSVAKEVKNFTCSDVGKAQGLIKKYSREGRSVLIFGKAKHPEVQGLMGYASDAHVVFSEDDVYALPPLKERVLLVSQTTMHSDAFFAIAECVKARYPDVLVINTICSATEARQEEASRMAERNDLVLVIGGAKSSNTKQLYDIAAKKTRAEYVNELADLKTIDFKGVKKLGITAGASTPDWFIEEAVRETRRLVRNPFARVLESAVSFLLASHIFIAVGAFVLSFAVTDILGFPFSFKISLLSSFYYLAMSLLNLYTNRRATKIHNRARYEFSYRFRFVFAAIFFVSLALTLILAFTLGVDILILTLFSTVLGVAYNLAYLPIPEDTPRLALFRIKRLPAFKSIIMGVAFMLLLNGLPALYNIANIRSVGFAHPIFHTLGIYFSSAYVCMIIFVRQTLFERKTMQSDTIAGVPGLSSVIGERWSRIVLYAFPTLLLVAMALGVFFGVYPMEKMKYFIAVIYNYALILLSENKKLLRSATAFELLVETNTYVAGFVALL